MTAECRQLATFQRIWLSAGAIMALLTVLAGAFGAHGLRGMVSKRSLDVFQTAVTYQMSHAIALVLVAMLPAHVARLARPSAFLWQVPFCAAVAFTCWY